MTPPNLCSAKLAMSGIQVPRVDADGQDADSRVQPRRLFTEPSSSNEPEPPRTPEATRVPLRAPLGADGREPLFAGPSSTYVPDTPPPDTPRTKIRRQLPESWQSPGDWAPEHNINPNPIRRKVLGGLLILGVACIGVVSVGGVPVPHACMPSACLVSACYLLPAHDMHVGFGRAVQDKHGRVCGSRRVVRLCHRASFAPRATAVASLVATVTVTTTVCVTREALTEY